MKRTAFTGFIVCATMSMPAAAQIDPDPAMNNPDKVSWELFVQVNKPAGLPGKNDVVFETWASNQDTFKLDPTFSPGAPPPTCGPPPVAVAAAPATPSPKILEVPALVQFAARRPGLVPHVVATKGGEEVRRNKTTFEFIYCNKLYTRAGLRDAFAAGKVISFPVDSIEVKANWVPAGNRDPSVFHINTASDNKQYALLSMHIISKQVPNWTWATFEHKDNPGRCDFIGCRDSFGATIQDVLPQRPPVNGSYPQCDKPPALKKMFTDAGLPALWENYCLKGSQVDFTTATGIPTLLGNSVPERGFVNTSSCLTCHSRASVNSTGQDIYGGGFITSNDPAVCPGGADSDCSPNGPPKPIWFWTNPSQPNPPMLALQTDFIWSIPLKAIGR